MAQIRPAPALQHKNKPSSKRKRDGELVSGGLIIVRSADAPPFPASQPTPARQRSETASIPPPSNSQPAPSTAHPPRTPSAHPPPAKKLRATSVSRTTAAGPSSLAGSAVSVHDPQVDEDIARMAGETEALRTPARPTASGAARPEFAVRSSPPRDTGVPVRLGKTPARTRDARGALNGEDSDRRGRDGMRAGPSSAQRRKSSLSARGKRASTSYDVTGVITHPHPSVPARGFHKHIDPEQPEAHRLRQLFMWCTSRAASDPPRPPDKDAALPLLPPLPAAGAEVLLAVQTDLIRLLADRQLDTAVNSISRTAPAGPRAENVQNVFNREREHAFRVAIDRAKQEDAAWNQVQAAYVSHQTSVIQGLPRAVERAKGKAREDVNTHELPAQFSGADGLELARQILLPASAPDLVEERLDGLLEYELDRVRHRVHSAAASVSAAEADISARFAALALTTRPPELATAALADPRANPDPGGQRAGRDPRALLRAVAARDGKRPQAQMPEAVRRLARGLARAADSGTAGLGPTSGPPGTPRRARASVAPGPGTPRRATTPARTR